MCQRALQQLQGLGQRRCLERARGLHRVRAQEGQSQRLVAELGQGLGQPRPASWRAGT